ncbi:hypothetical protein J4E91_011148 [Alternaria rosae]|nr:hypothetical protein J4E91_011148 [Alternaria rosae]
MAISTLLMTIGALIVSALFRVLSVGYQKRLRIYSLREQGVAMPAGWSWWFGHLRVLNKKLQALPADANVFLAMDDMVQQHADAEVFLMDYWPVLKPVLMLSGPEVAAQVSTKHDLPKPIDKEASFAPIIGGPSLITMNDAQWKFWRSLLSPGFSASHVLSLVPSIVDAMDVFCELLEEQVGGGIFLLDTMATQLAMDVIARTSLDTNLDNQRSEHYISHALNAVLRWHSFWDPRILLNPLRIPIQWYYGRVLSTFIDQELKKRFKEMKNERAIGKDTRSRQKKVKSVIALALDDFLTRKHKTDKQAFNDIELDRNFARIATNQIRLFLFAGNDTTATAIVYAFHMMSRHPEDLLKMREEHDAVFGPGREAGGALRNSPALVNRCRYTLAIVKETLRLYPPASSIKEGIPGVSLTDRKGNVIPTEHLNATIMHRYIHINPRLWSRPMEFLPERWLVEKGHELYPPHSGYRPFELGSRNCIGQTLVSNEIRVALIMTVRKFFITPAYDAWDAANLGCHSLFSKMLNSLGLGSEGYKTVRGERAYQTSRSGAHPADGYPCCVSLVKS